ncbi:hypothetical protein HYV49_04875 [Candidatus Pacearchaeota archaeon]|nr:hypothetical protein [Candidatus Pacearchaeota archaeon]
MLKVYKVETKQAEASKRAVEVSQDLTANEFISGLSECRSEYNKILDIFEENHRKIYDVVRGIVKDNEYILLCMEERWGLGHPETNFGVASLEPLLGQIFWRSWTTVNMQRNYNPDIPEEPTFKKAFKRFVKEYFEQKMAETPVLVSDQHNLQRCLSVLDEMGLEYKIIN